MDAQNQLTHEKVCLHLPSHLAPDALFTQDFLLVLLPLVPLRLPLGVAASHSGIALAPRAFLPAGECPQRACCVDFHGMLNLANRQILQNPPCTVCGCRMEIDDIDAGSISQV